MVSKASRQHSWSRVGGRLVFAGSSNSFVSNGGFRSHSTGVGLDQLRCSQRTAVAPLSVEAAAEHCIARYIEERSAAARSSRCPVLIAVLLWRLLRLQLRRSTAVGWGSRAAVAPSSVGALAMHTVGRGGRARTVLHIVSKSITAVVGAVRAGPRRLASIANGAQRSQKEEQAAGTNRSHLEKKEQQGISKETEAFFSLRIQISRIHKISPKSEIKPSKQGRKIGKRWTQTNWPKALGSKKYSKRWWQPQRTTTDAHCFRTLVKSVCS